MSASTPYPVPRLHKPSGQARVRHKGRDVYLGKYGSPAAQDAYQRLLAEIAGVGPPRPRDAPITVAEIAMRWLHDNTSVVSPKEHGQYASALAVLRDVCGEQPAKDFGTGGLKKVRASMISKDWCRNVVNRQVVRIGTVWRWAELENLIPEGRYSALKTLPGIPETDRSVRHTERTRPATFAEVKALIRHVTPTVRAMLLVQWWTGSRSGEIRTMRAGEVNTENWDYTPKQHKNAHRGHDCTIHLGPKARAVLLPWLTAAQEQGKDAFVFPVRPRGRVRSKTTKRYGRRKRASPPQPDYSRCYSDSAYGRAVERAAAKLGLDGLRCYSVRHGAKMRIARAVGSEGARTVLRHKHLSTTDKYGSRDVELARQIMERFG